MLEEYGFYTQSKVGVRQKPATLSRVQSVLCGEPLPETGAGILFSITLEELPYGITILPQFSKV